MNRDDYLTNINPTWCPGCGLYTMRNFLIQALFELNIEPHNLVITYDIGCNGNTADKIRSYGFKSLHGRSIPPAIGVKISNKNLNVISIIGDGGMFWEGPEHWITSAQRNENVTVIVCDNQIYGLTTGQTSPTTPKGVHTITNPDGGKDDPINPISISIASGATFVSRAWAGDPEHYKEVLKQSITHKGFAIVDFLSQCVTWNKVNTITYYKDIVYKLNSDHDIKSKTKAYEIAEDSKKIALGVIYKTEKETTEDKYSFSTNGNNNIDDLLVEFQ